MRPKYLTIIRAAGKSSAPGVRLRERSYRHQMATRQHRLNEFNNGPPPPNRPLQLLCEDHNGTYVLPYPSQWCDGAWHNCACSKAIEAKVVGWRVPPSRKRRPNDKRTDQTNN